MRTTSEIGVRELDRRSNDGITVTLPWNARPNRVLIAVEDERRNDALTFNVDPADALEAFRHPYGYTARDCADRARAA